MKAGDLGIFLVSTDTTRMNDHCLILGGPSLAKVGAWGVQEEVRVLYRGKEISIPVYYVRVVETTASVDK